MKSMLTLMLAALMPSLLFSDEELPRTWTSVSGQILEGTFWKVERGVVELKKADGSMVPIKITSLSPEDVTHIIRKGGGVWAPTTKRLAGNYVISPKGDVEPRRPSDVKISGTVTAVISQNMLSVTDGRATYVVACETDGYKPNATFSCWGRVGGEDIVLPEGTTGKLFSAYKALDDIEETGRLVQKDPLKFGAYFTGESAACAAWKAQNIREEKVQASEERRTDMQEKIMAERQAAQDERSQKRQDGKDAKLADKLEENIKDYERQIKSLESNIRSWEAKKRRSKMHSDTYNAMRKRIAEAEVKIRKLENSVNEAQAELRKLKS